MVRNINLTDIEKKDYFQNQSINCLRNQSINPCFSSCADGEHGGGDAGQPALQHHPAPPRRQARPQFKETVSQG